MKKFKLFSLLALMACVIQVSASATSPVVSTTINGVTIRIEKGDITRSTAQAIVNAANPQLQAGGGVCGAIFAAAGLEQLQKACDQIPLVKLGLDHHMIPIDKTIKFNTEQDILYIKEAILPGYLADWVTYWERCPVGSACITDSFDLAKDGIQYIIHAVGPDCRIIKDPQKQDVLLHSAYLNALSMAEKNNVTTVAFPFISSAIYAFPKERAARIALQAMMGYAADKGLKDKAQPIGGLKTKVATVSFVLFSDEDYDLFVKTLDLVAV